MCKNFIYLFIVSVVLYPTTLKAQEKRFYTDTISSLNFEIGYNKTSNIIFPSDIKSIDRGSSFILVQKAAGVENILQVKADKRNFPETNLTVVTTDGSFYSFLVKFTGDPAVLNLCVSNDIGRNVGRHDNISVEDLPINRAIHKQVVNKIQRKAPFMSIHMNSQKLKLSLEKIYLKEGLMWFGFKIKNRSFVDYKPQYLRFFTKDLNRVKRTAQQEIDIEQAFSNLPSKIAGKKSETVIIACEPFTVPASQELDIQLGEKTGGRTIKLRVRHRALLNARLLK